MPQSVSAVTVHAVFSTKERIPFLSDPVFRKSMHAYLAGISQQCNCPVLEIGGMADHVHALANLSRTIPQADWIKELKRASSLWAKQTQKKFAWQSGYAIFSVSFSNLDAVRRYIRDQEAHHAKHSFQEEYLALLQRHNLQWDDRYVWD